MIIIVNKALSEEQKHAHQAKLVKNYLVLKQTLLYANLNKKQE